MTDETNIGGRTIGMENRDSLVDLNRKLDQHLNDHKVHEVTYEARCVKQEEESKRTIAAIDKLTQATTDIVEAWKVARGVQKFVKWASTFAAIGVILSWLHTKFPTVFG